MGSRNRDGGGMGLQALGVDIGSAPIGNALAVVRVAKTAQSVDRVESRETAKRHRKDEELA